MSLRSINECDNLENENSSDSPEKTIIPKPTSERNNTPVLNEDLDWLCNSCSIWNYGDSITCSCCKADLTEFCKRYDPKKDIIIEPEVSKITVSKEISKFRDNVKRGDWLCM